jgi:glycine cleavage system H lipoate-binding protein
MAIRRLQPLLLARQSLLARLIHPLSSQALRRAYSQELEVLDVQKRYNQTCEVKRVHARDEDGDLLFYEFGPNAQTLTTLKDLAFVDIVNIDVLVAGRECCMLENSLGHQVTIKAPVDGDVLHINEELIQDPASLAAKGTESSELS